MDSKSVSLNGGARRRKSKTSVKRSSKRTSKSKKSGKKMSGGAKRRSKRSSKRSSKSKTSGKKMSGGAKRRSKRSSKRSSKRNSKSKTSGKKIRGGDITLDPISNELPVPNVSNIVSQVPLTPIVPKDISSMETQEKSPSDEPLDWGTRIHRHPNSNRR